MNIPIIINITFGPIREPDTYIIDTEVDHTKKVFKVSYIKDYNIVRFKIICELLPDIGLEGIRKIPFDNSIPYNDKLEQRLMISFQKAINKLGASA